MRILATDVRVDEVVEVESNVVREEWLKTVRKWNREVAEEGKCSQYSNYKCFVLID